MGKSTTAGAIKQLRDQEPRDPRPEMTLEQSVVIGSMSIIFEGIYQSVKEDTVTIDDLDCALKLLLTSIKETFSD